MILPGTERGTGAAGGGGAKAFLRPEISTARKLRRIMSLPEVLLWQHLRSGRTGAKFRRQHPIGPYIVDFFCRDVRLVVEIDGQAHGRSDRPARDMLRDQFLNENGYGILRVPATDVLRNIDGVIAVIGARVASPLHQPAAGPPPRSGED